MVKRVWYSEGKTGENTHIHAHNKREPPKWQRTAEPENLEMDATATAIAIATATAISTADDDEVLPLQLQAASLRGKKVAMEKI